MKVNLPKHILELLLKNETVSVPGLGTFSFVNKSASFGEGRKSLLPPGKKIAYTELHKNDDETLAQLISEKNDLSQDYSKAFIEEFSSEVLSNLMSSNQVEIAYLGQLEKDEQGKINFISNIVTEERLNKWRPELMLPEAQAVDPPVFKEEKVSMPKPVSQVGTRVEPVPMIQNDPSIGTTESGTGLKSYIIAALGLLGLLALLVFSFRACSSDESSFMTKAEIENQEYLEDQERNQNEKGVEEINYTEEDGNNEVEDDDNAYANEKASVDEVIEELGEADQNDMNCIIILGSFTNDVNVQAITRKVRNSSHQLYTENHGPYTRVGVQASCNDISNNYSEFLRKVRADFNINGAWYLNPELKDL